jgi:hypothetical protein
VQPLPPRQPPVPLPPPLPRSPQAPPVAAGAAVAAGTTIAAGAGAADETPSQDGSLPLRNARFHADRLVSWQAPYGGPHLKNSPYRSSNNATVIQGVGPQVRALYRMFERTGKEAYKVAADRNAVFFLTMLHDPPTPYSNLTTINGETFNLISTSWMYGKGLSPCFEWFVKFNPDQTTFDLKARAIYRWLQVHRRDDSYFGVGYPNGDYPDAQFSCDLGEVGTGLVGFYKHTRHEPALRDALGLATYFLTEHEEGSGRGVWSSPVGTWLVGPWPGGGAEHFTGQQYNTTGWGWSCLVVGEFLLALREFVTDEATRDSIDAKCVAALKWCLDQCQFDDGAHGMFGRDDKWVGQTAAAISLYGELVERELVPAEVAQAYRPKLEKAWEWLLAHTGPDTYPEDGYIRVTGSTTTKPPENLLWMMSWTIES